ncbi:MAG: polysaccharide lyase family 7 protein [Flavobacteriaceae bacterium]
MNTFKISLRLRIISLFFCVFIMFACSSDAVQMDDEIAEMDSMDEEEVVEEVEEEEEEEEEEEGNSEGEFGLDPNLEPWENFDLSDWVIDTPAFDANDGLSERYGELDWSDLVLSNSRPFFFTHTDGGMRFVSTVGGARTSQNTSFPRSELREMLRSGNTSISTTGANGNNWALGYQPESTDHGGRNGVLKATLRVNQVTTTGSGLHPGRTIIGQIHADNDEPARLYFRKLPNAQFGCIYVEHEIRDGDDVTFNLIGDEDCEGNGPAEGIQLDELFSYEIINEGEIISVRIRRGDQDGEIIGEATINMETLNSGYDLSDEWMYFKAGAYTQNNTGSDDDSDVITFYRLSNTHDSN